MAKKINLIRTRKKQGKIAHTGTKRRGGFAYIATVEDINQKFVEKDNERNANILLKDRIKLDK